MIHLSPPVTPMESIDVTLATKYIEFCQSMTGNSISPLFSLTLTLTFSLDTMTSDQVDLPVLKKKNKYVLTVPVVR